MSGAADDLARRGAAWWADLEQLAKRDPIAAGELARAQLDHLRSYSPESLAPLGGGFPATTPCRPPEVRRGG